MAKRPLSWFTIFVSEWPCTNERFQAIPTETYASPAHGDFQRSFALLDQVEELRSKFRPRIGMTLLAFPSVCEAILTASTAKHMGH